MNQDLKIIKKQYGEKMMHLCRELFATILDNSPGTLSQILLDKFNPNHYLYDDLIEGNDITNFKDYIYSIYLQKKNTSNNIENIIDDPVTLMKQAGYTLYVCTTEKEIQKFRKYYAPGEELCTFRDNRLKYCYVYFAVHENADKLNRCDYPNPVRQDEYGTSVISIQFTRDSSHTLSIKNRYNHTVGNPDATFSNNLDNIIHGLTKSFAEYYGMKQSAVTNLDDFELMNYVRANDGKLYKYNYEIDNVYYCPDNIVIDNFEVQRYPKERYLVMDYFIFDLANKTIINEVRDYFSKTIPDIKKINIINESECKKVILTPNNGEDIIIMLDKFNRIISYQNNNVLEIGKYFLSDNEVLSNIFLNKVTKIGSGFLPENHALKKISLPNLLSVGNFFLECNSSLEVLFLPKLESIGDNFLDRNRRIEKIYIPRVLVIGDNFCRNNVELRNIYLPNVRKIGDRFLCQNESITKIDLPNVLEIGGHFLLYNCSVKDVNLPKIKFIGCQPLRYNFHLNTFNAPEIASLVDEDLVTFWNNHPAHDQFLRLLRKK